MFTDEFGIWLKDENERVYGDCILLRTFLCWFVVKYGCLALFLNPDQTGRSD